MKQPIPLQYQDADESLKIAIAHQWGETAARHMHLQDGFSIVALHGEKPVGLVSVYWRSLPPPLDAVHEGYIDIIEVHPNFRRQGIARHLVALCLERAQAHGAYQVRAWSSEDKQAAIDMWQALGFSLCPAVTYPQGKEVRGFYAACICIST